MPNFARVIEPLFTTRLLLLRYYHRTYPNQIQETVEEVLAAMDSIPMSSRPYNALLYPLFHAAANAKRRSHMGSYSAVFAQWITKARRRGWRIYCASCGTRKVRELLTEDMDWELTLCWIHVMYDREYWVIFLLSLRYLNLSKKATHISASTSGPTSMTSMTYGPMHLKGTMYMLRRTSLSNI